MVNTMVYDYVTAGGLDECRGLTSQIVVTGKTTITYHYVMTRDIQYSASCFRGTVVWPPDHKPQPA